ncbi:Calcipressin-domain-containing protein [Gilbertella persicaria]|nr:Calcipressin-domain-containing protein [Gilbertella persicaria]KAI8087049.1 Calcipressin-domain-containing protein [Gilbertella persicaria]
MTHFDKAESIATNTLLVPDVPLCFFGCDDAMLTIHDAFAKFGLLYTFVPMKGFRRLMIIYQETTHALEAKKTLNHSILAWKQREPFPEILELAEKNIDLKKDWQNQGKQVFDIRVYFGQHFAIHVDPNSNSLQVPQFQRNLLISPPGSPCEGWEQIEEDAPNQAILASDLMHAAEISDYELDDDELELEERPVAPKTVSIVCSKGLEKPEELPAITVQDWDGYSGASIPRKKLMQQLTPTAMPPLKK